MQENIEKQALLKSVIKLSFELRNWFAESLLGDYSFIGIPRNSLSKKHSYKDFYQFDFDITELFYKTSKSDTSHLNSLAIIESIRENNFISCFFISLFTDIRDPNVQDRHSLPDFFLDALILVNQGYLTKEDFWKRCEEVDLKIGYRSTYFLKNKKNLSYSISELKNDSRDYKSASFKNTEIFLFQCIDHFLISKKKEIDFLMNFNKNVFLSYISHIGENNKFADLLSNESLRVAWRDDQKSYFYEEIISVWRNQGCFFQIFNDNNKNDALNIRNRNQNEKKLLTKALWSSEDEFIKYLKIIKQNSNFVNDEEDKAITDYLKETFESLEFMSEKELNVHRIYEEKVNQINYLVQQSIEVEGKSNFSFLFFILVFSCFAIFSFKNFSKIEDSKQ